MRRTGTAAVAAALAIAIFASSSQAKGDPDGHYRGTGDTTIYLNRDGRMISYFVSDVHTSCLVGNMQPSTVIVQTTGKANISVSRKGRFTASVPFRDVQGFPNSGVASVSGRLKGTRISGHVQGSNTSCSFAQDYAVTLRHPF